jgi:ABC-type dipeptide/oligopeptide/nickel transport system ATPase component
VRSDGQYVLQVEALTINLATAAGPVTIVDKVSFAVERQRTLCVVGESGSGKTLTARSIMRLLDAPLHIDPAARIMLDGRNLMTLDDTAMRRIRGAEIAMIFQEPMSFLNPVYTVGIRSRNRWSTMPGCLGARQRRAPKTCSAWLAFPRRRGGCWRSRSSACRPSCGWPMR